MTSRGFTGLSDATEPEWLSALVRRFYACTQEVLFPSALIDKLIDNDVMAPCIPRMYRIEARPFQALDEWLEAYRRLWTHHLDALERHLDNQEER